MKPENLMKIHFNVGKMETPHRKSAVITQTCNFPAIKHQVQTEKNCQVRQRCPASAHCVPYSHQMIQPIKCYTTKMPMRNALLKPGDHILLSSYFHLISKECLYYYFQKRTCRSKHCVSPHEGFNCYGEHSVLDVRASGRDWLWLTAMCEKKNSKTIWSKHGQPHLYSREHLLYKWNRYKDDLLVLQSWQLSICNWFQSASWTQLG